MKYIYSIALLLIATTTFSQYYTRDVGIMWGNGTQFSYRQFFDEENALEGFVGFSDRGFRVMGMKEHFQPFLHEHTDNLRLVYGYGVHAGVAYTNKYDVLGRTYYHDWLWTPRFGIDGLIGVDFTTPDLPILVSLANQPYFEYSLNNFFKLRIFNVVISVKYRF